MPFAIASKPNEINELHPVCPRPINPLKSITYSIVTYKALPVKPIVVNVPSDIKKIKSFRLIAMFIRIA